MSLGPGSGRLVAKTWQKCPTTYPFPYRASTWNKSEELATMHITLALLVEKGAEP